MISHGVVQLIILLIVVGVVLALLNGYVGRPRSVGGQPYIAGPILMIINAVIVICTLVYVLRFFHIIGGV